MRNWLKALRTESQSVTAKKIGISKSMYIAIESGRKSPSLESAIKIADVMGFSMDMWKGDK